MDEPKWLRGISENPMFLALGTCLSDEDLRKLSDFLRFRLEERAVLLAHIRAWRRAAKIAIEKGRLAELVYDDEPPEVKA